MMWLNQREIKLIDLFNFLKKDGVVSDKGKLLWFRLVSAEFHNSVEDGEKKVLRNKQASSTPTLTDTVPEAEPNESAFGGGWSAPYSSHCFIFPSLFPTVYCRHDVRTVSTETQWEVVRVVVTVSMFAWYTVKYNPECLWVLSGDRTSAGSVSCVNLLSWGAVTAAQECSQEWRHRRPGSLEWMPAPGRSTC